MKNKINTIFILITMFFFNSCIKDFGNSKWETCLIELPKNIGHIKFYRKKDHPNLQEYERKFEFIGEKINGELKLPGNSGGSIRMDLYLTTIGDEKFIRIVDLTSGDRYKKRYLINLSNRIIYTFDGSGDNGGSAKGEGKYLSYYDEKTEKVILLFIEHAKETELGRVKIGNNGNLVIIPIPSTSAPNTPNK